MPVLGYYWVDPNAGVKLDAIQVYCDFRSKKIYTCVLPTMNIVSMIIEKSRCNSDIFFNQSTDYSFTNFEFVQNISNPQ